MIGEVKYYSDKIDKSKIREFIGVIKDIQENYFSTDNDEYTESRVSELGVYFSASGFDDNAERLAFAHNIKTVSYKNNLVIDKICSIISELERNYIYAKHVLARGVFNDFYEDFSAYLDENLSANFFTNKYLNADGIENLIDDLLIMYKSIKANFVATTSNGVFLHFLGYEAFPDDLFTDTDIQSCEVYYDRNSYYMIFSADNYNRRFYFTPPKALKEAAFYGGRTVLDRKSELFRQINVSMNIRGIRRNLDIRLNSTWLNENYNRY